MDLKHSIGKAWTIFRLSNQVQEVFRVMWRYVKEAKYIQGVGGVRNHFRSLRADGNRILKQMLAAEGGRG